MPIYEYECKKCGENFEVLQNINEDPLTECPSCGGKVEKHMSTVVVRPYGMGSFLTEKGKRERGKKKEKKGEFA